MNDKKIRVAITNGDTNGIGYEMILKAFEDPTMLELCTPIVYGSPNVAAYHANVLRIETQFNVISQASEAHPNRLNLIDCFGSEEVKVDFGVATPESGHAALKSLERAVEDYQKGLFDVLVTTPVNRSTINGFQGHADYLERKLGKHQGISILLNDDLRVALVTNNVAVKDISEAITKQKIVDKCMLFNESLRRDMRISSPRIAILSLNPRCGEEGALGDEEQETIIPAIEELEANGVMVFGPYAADNFFGSGDYYHFDGVLAMYHDQGLTPFKTISPDDGVRFTAGLPIVRTAPAIGTQFAVAGRNQTEATMLRHAVYTAIDVFRNRKEYDEPLQHQLPKLYHEKRDDSEKVRFRSATPGQADSQSPVHPKTPKD